MSQKEQVYKWQTQWDGTVPLPSGLQGIYEDEILTLTEAKRLIRAAAELYGMPMPKVLGRPYWEHRKGASFAEGTLWLPRRGRSVPITLHEFAHYAETVAHDDEDAHGAHFVTIFTDVLHAFGIAEKHFARWLARTLGIRIASERTTVAPLSRDWEAGLDYIKGGHYAPEPSGQGDYPDVEHDSGTGEESPRPSTSLRVLCGGRCHSCLQGRGFSR